jgi:hypothetical protein
MEESGRPKPAMTTAHHGIQIINQVHTSGGTTEGVAIVGFGQWLLLLYVN